jgi:hypothetical protein
VLELLMKSRHGLALIAAVTVLTGTGVARAQERSEEIDVTDEVEPRWGVASSSVKAIPAMAFQESFQGGGTPGPQLFSFIPSGTGIFSRHLMTSSTATNFFAALDLPTGAQIMGMRLESCDTSNTGEVRFTLRWLPVANNSSAPGFFVNSGTTATPGCTTHGSATNLSGSNVFVDNEANTYLLQVTLGTQDTTNSFRSVRVNYRLRVSPSPGVARFADVPTNHIFFQWIEALAASGITGGCGGSNFCPSANITRGEMAVFLATALGLHFPN